MRRTTYLLAGLGLIAVGAVAGQWLHQRSPTAAQSRALNTLRSAYEVIRESYVEPVSSDSLAASSIRGMVGRLDPFSVYIAPRRMEQVEESFRGSFEGIGISYELIAGTAGQDTILVMSVVEGGPSAKAGLRAGDRIVAVEGDSAIGWSHQRIQRRLKGPGGSTVAVTLRRPGARDVLRTTITRGTVPLETVEATYMMGPRTGYLRLDRFARTTDREVTEALQALKEQGMERLLLDLRGNAGGLMSMAERVADEFLVEGQLIVTARSRHDEFGGRRYATEEGQLEDAPMVVLVDEHSASASEIVAGALQDHDRAVLVGRRTFGKGLIQRQYDLEGGSGLRITVARFYTPSGRLLQRPGERRRDSVVTGRPTEKNVPSAVPDSLLYRSDAGRPLIGGGGIQPDRVVEAPERTPFRRAVDSTGALRDFARRWIDAHTTSLRAKWERRPDAFASTFEVPDTVYAAFRQYAANRGVRVSPEPDGEAGSGPTARAGVESTITAYVAQRLFGAAMRQRIQNQTDPVVSAARSAWATAEDWAARYPVAQ